MMMSGFNTELDRLILAPNLTVGSYGFGWDGKIHARNQQKKSAAERKY